MEVLCLVGSGDQAVLFDDSVYGATACLDVLLLVEVCGDRSYYYGYRSTTIKASVKTFKAKAKKSPPKPDLEF
jgi:hypothetical protein